MRKPIILKKDNRTPTLTENQWPMRFVLEKMMGIKKNA